MQCNVMKCNVCMYGNLMQCNAMQCNVIQRDVCKSPCLLNDMCPSQLFLEKWPFIVRRSLYVAHGALREFWLCKSWWEYELSQQDSHILMCLSQLQVIFKTSSHISIFISYFYVLWPTPEMDAYPAEEHLMPNNVNTCKYHENSLCARLNGMYHVCTHLKGSCCFFSFFFSKETWLRALWKSVEFR